MWNNEIMKKMKRQIIIIMKIIMKWKWNNRKIIMKIMKNEYNNDIMKMKIIMKINNEIIIMK